MTRASHRISACATALAALSVLANAQAPASPTPIAPANALELRVDGARAPSGTWYARGGCAARCGVTDTVLPFGRPRTLWTYTSDGELEGEPLVWHDDIVLEVRNGSGGRRLELVTLAAGARVARTDWRSSARPLSPSLYDDYVLVHDGAHALELHDVSARSFDLVWTLAATNDVRAPLLFEKEVYACVDGALERWEVGASERTWTVKSEFRGELCLRGPWIYALEYRAGYATLARYNRADGAPGDAWTVGQHGGAIPELDAPVQSRISVLDPQAFVYHSLPVPLTDGSSRTLARVDLAAPGSHALLAPTLGESVDWERGWIGYTNYEGGSTSLLRLSGLVDEAAQELASTLEHPEFVTGTPPLAIAAGACLVGARAFDVDDGRVLWSLETPVIGRAIPVDGGVLLRTAPNTLVALGASSPRASATAAIPLAFSQLDGKLQKARAVLSDGAVLVGAFEAGAAAGELVYTGGGARRVLEAGAIAQFEDAEGRIRGCSNTRRIVEWSRASMRAELADAYTELAAAAVAAKDHELARRCVKRAQANGGKDAELERTSKRAEELAKKPTTPNKKAKADLDAREAELQRRPITGLARRAAKLSADAPFEARYELLRAVLRRDARSAEALDALRALLPAGLVDDPSADPAGWLEFARLLQGLEVRVVPTEASADAADPARDALKLARTRWRPDLKGLATPRAVVIAPADRPTALANAMRLSDAAVEAIAALCAAGAAPDTATRAAAERRPLVIHLYGSRAEYAARAPAAAGTEPARAGHVDVQTGILHCALAPGDERLVRHSEALAYEVARAWLGARQPRPIEYVPPPPEPPKAAAKAANETRAAAASQPAPTQPTDAAPAQVQTPEPPQPPQSQPPASQPAESKPAAEARAWVLDGACSLAAGAVAQRTRIAPEVRWSEFTALSRVLDLRGRLFSWAPFVEFGVQEIEGFARRPLRSPPPAQYLGAPPKPWTGEAIRAQAGSLCHYLYYAEEGKHRARLLAEFARCAQGASGELDFAATFGVEIEKFALRVLDWAQQCAG